MTTERTETPLTVLIVEDDENLRSALEALVASQGAQAKSCGRAEEASALLAQQEFDAALVDLTLPDGSGLDLLGHPDARGRPEYIVVTGDATAESAVEALKRGALDYLTKPVDRARLRSVLENVRRTRALRHQVSGLRSQLRELGCFGAMVGRSEAMQKIYELIERVAPTEATVFVAGESGTGKELVAETIHRLSRRSSADFVAVNCGAMAPTLIESELFGHEKGSFTGADRRRAGYFERADGGTLLLDEITEMPAELQVKLLRVLETGTVTRVGGSEPVAVDVRVIAASNRDPAEAVAAGAFREDLLYRLNVFPVELPPLRSRGGDVALLAEHFLAAINAREGTAKRLTPAALDRLQAQPWPGNVRELKNIIERAWILADVSIDADVIPSAEGGTAEPEPSVLHVRVGASLADVERRMILATLDALGGNKKQTAARLGISLKTLYNRLAVYKAQPADDAKKGR